jgi:hypothetical protein
MFWSNETACLLRMHKNILSSMWKALGWALILRISWLTICLQGVIVEDQPQRSASMKLIAIDPGANGAVVMAIVNDLGILESIQANPMPDTPADILALFYRLMETDPQPTMCLTEKVGGYQPGNSGPAAVTFARHCGHLDIALIAAKIPYEAVAPASWMKEFLITLPKSTYKKTGDKKADQKAKYDAKQVRKHAIQDKAQRIFPQVKVTLNNADALGLLHVLMRRYQTK